MTNNIEYGDDILTTKVFTYAAVFLAGSLFAGSMMTVASANSNSKSSSRHKPATSTQVGKVNYGVGINGSRAVQGTAIVFAHQTYLPVSEVQQFLTAAGLQSKASTRELNINVPAKPEVTSGNVIVNGSALPGVSPILFGNTPYVPADVVNQFAVPGTWNASTNTESIGVSPTGAYLTSILSSYAVDSSHSVNYDAKMSMGGQTYTHGLQIASNDWSGTNSVYYNLQGRYKLLTGIVGLDDGVSGTVSSAEVDIIADGQQIYSTTVGTGTLPQSFSVPVSGVKNLQFMVHGNGNVTGNVDWSNVTVQ